MEAEFKIVIAKERLRPKGGLKKHYPTRPFMFADLISQLADAPEGICDAEYRERQSRLLSQLAPSDLLIICTNPVAKRSNDVNHPFRSSSDMLYLCGWEEEKGVLIAHYIKGEGWSVELFVEPRNVLMEVWNGRLHGLEGAEEKYPIDKAHSYNEMNEILGAYLLDAKRVVLRNGVNNKVDKLVDAAISNNSRPRQQLGLGPTSIASPNPMIAELRLRKSPAEIALLRHASDISSLAHIAAMKVAKADIGEWQIQATLEGFFRYAKGSGWAYPSIVGCGENATILHYSSNNMTCKDGEVILIDAAAEYCGYASDITRSWPINGEFTPDQKKIYTLVLDAQKAAIAECVVGNLFTAPHDKACEIMAEGLIEMGILQCSLEDALGPEGELRQWYMHNTSHWIGLDVHDVGIYRPDGEARKFEAGMVLTIEPGLYFGGWRPDVEIEERWSGIGIRIEDDVLITDEGPDVLTAKCPKEISELENIIGSDN